MTQSRWAEEFARHPFQAHWAGLKIELANIEVDDPTVTTSVIELARLKRVIAYLDEIISTIDLDLTPRSVWSNFHPQAEACLQHVKAYAAKKNIAYLNNANEHADNLLTYVRPYLVLPQEAMRVLQNSARTYASELGDYVATFRDKTASLVNEIKKDRESSVARLRGLERTAEKIEALSRELFDEVDGVVPKKTQIENFVADVAAKTKQVNDLHADLLVDRPDKKSIQTETKNAETEILVRRKDMTKVLEAAQSHAEGLEGFHERIFGKQDDGKGETTGGLKSELDTRMAALKTFEEDQQTKHKALLERIESLLPGATSAGLGRAYRVMKESFDDKIKLYTILFYTSLSLIVVGAMFTAMSRFSIYPELRVDLIEIPQWDVILRGLLVKAGFIVPVVWLALFSATRRSQYERLQQEYAHKEAFAASYESYKKQLQDLNGASEDLQRELIAKAVDAIAYNASKTLDGKHQEKLPLHQLLEKANFEQLQKLLKA